MTQDPFSPLSPIAVCERCGDKLATGRRTGWCSPCKRRARIERQAYTHLAQSPQSWILLDSETTGLKANQDEVIDLALLSASGKVLFSSLIRPLAHQVDGSPAQAIHHITDHDLRGAPLLTEIWSTLSPIFASVQQVITYNAPFDHAMLEHNAKRAGLAWPTHLNWWCLMDAFAHWYGQALIYERGYRWQKLALACQTLNVDVQAFTQEHRALGDAQRAYAVLEALAVRAPEAIGSPFASAVAARLEAARQTRETKKRPASGFWQTLFHLFSSQGGH